MGIHLILSFTVILNSNVVSIKMFQKRKHDLSLTGDTCWAKSLGAKHQTFARIFLTVVHKCVSLQLKNKKVTQGFSPKTQATLPPSVSLVLD